MKKIGAFMAAVGLMFCFGSFAWYHVGTLKETMFGLLIACMLVFFGMVIMQGKEKEAR